MVGPWGRRLGRKWARIAGMGCALATLAAGGARANDQPRNTTAANRCPLGQTYRATSVTADQAREQGYGQDVQRLRGADVHVAAQPGLTQEWLQKSIEHGIASGDCDFGARNVKVNVLSAGNGFDVQLTAPDEKSAREVLRHAQGLVERR